MERITYRKTLDVHKNGIQFMLQGFETADNLSRVIEISLMASGDAIDFPLERIVAMMYVTSPGASEPSINKCTIKDNKVVYDVLPIVVEGITQMQLKIIETGPDGATSVLASPKFAVEVLNSNMGEDGSELKTEFTALEDAVAKAKTVYDERFIRMELDSECLFKAWYADGTYYETDVLQKLFKNGNVLLSESYAHGGTGVRTGEDTDNSKYYSNVSKSEALNAKNIMVNSEEILEEVKLHGVYTAFKVDFVTGEVEYVSPSFKFKVNKDTGHLDAEGQTYSFENEVFRVVDEWLLANNIVLGDLQAISTTHTTKINTLENLTKKVPIKNGGTGATTVEEAITALGVDKYQKPWDLNVNVGKINTNSETVSFANTSTTEVVEEVIDIPMINSGNIYLSFYVDSDDTSDSRFDFIVTEMSVYVNNDVIYTEPEPGIMDKEYKLKLNVVKNDIVKIVVKGLANTDTYNCACKIENISILANIDTPYKYGTLPESLNTISSSDILNALLGV